MPKTHICYKASTCKHRGYGIACNPHEYIKGVCDMSRCTKIDQCVYCIEIDIEWDK